MTKSNGFIINVALTGVIPVQSMTPHVPITHDEIVADVIQCAALGVQMVHLHARDEMGAQTGDPSRYGDLITALRGQPGCQDLVVCVTTSGRAGGDDESRARVLDLTGKAKPDMASLTLGSMNFAQSASVNSPKTIRFLAQRMLDRGIKPEIEVFDVGMAHFVNILVREGLLRSPIYVNILLGNMFGSQPDPIQLGAILSALPPDSIVSLAGLGRFQLRANGLAVALGLGIRTGIEDNIWFDRDRKVHATNAMLVKRMIAMAAIFERAPMERGEIRALLQLPPL